MSHAPGVAHVRAPWLGIWLACGLAGLTLAGPTLLAIDPLAQDLGAAFEAPCQQWLLGTDELGRSVLARLVVAAPLSLGVAIAAAVATAAIGTALGTFAAVSSGLIEQAVLALADLTYAVPSLLLVLLAAGLFGSGIETVLPALVLARWPVFARTCHPLARAALAAPAAEASLLLGFGTLYRMRRHAWPAVRPTVISLAALGVGGNVLAVASLGFIGIGLAPAMALFVATLATTLIGEAWAEANREEAEE